MTRKIPVLSVPEPALADVAGSIKDGLLAFASATGLLVMHQLLEAELAARIGPKHARLPNRAGNWHGRRWAR